MKKIMIISLLTAVSIAGGYTKTSAQAKNTSSPVFYIDSKKVDFPVTWIDPANISSVQVDKDADPGGRIYLTMKTPHTAFLSLADIGRKKSVEDRNVLYIIDDSVILDTAKVRIDPSFIVQVMITNSKDISYLAKKMYPTTILLISTKRKHAVAGEPQIWIH